MKKMKMAIILFFFTILNSTTLYAFDLISEIEYMQYLGDRSDKPKKALSRSLFDGKKNLPEINVSQPIIGMEIPSPTNIRLSFTAKDGSKIDVASLRFLYGWLGLDITNRIKENAVITVSGLSADNVTLPKGEHVITVKISDVKGRTTEKEIEFIIK